MDPSLFKENAPGKVIRNFEGQWAFVPDPLPPSLDLSRETALLLSNADQRMSELASVGKNPRILIEPFLRHEAVFSCRIEGIVANEEDLLLFNVNPTVEAISPDVRQVANYVIAFEYGLHRIKQLPISLRLIRELHGSLMPGVRGAGEFRKVQNYIGVEGQGIETARFVPPPVSELGSVLDHFEKFVGQPTNLPLLIALALIHYQFETIHPFVDGNGRIGRLLLSLLLCERELLPMPLLCLSAYFENHRNAYVDLLADVSRNAQWEPWIAFFLRGVAEQSGAAIAQTKRLAQTNCPDQSRVD